MGNFVKEVSEPACIVASDATWMEDAAIAQLIVTSQLEGMQRVAGMPDLHPGRGYPVGAAFFSSTHLYPALVGNDIGCGMALWQTDLHASSVKLDKLEKRVGNIDGPMEDRAFVEHAMTAAGVRTCDSEVSLGTIGGGNHFAELQQVDAVYLPEALATLGIDKQHLLLLVHSGSRGLGEQILRTHIDAFGHHGLRTGSSEAMAYLEQHEAALRFAQCNRSFDRSPAVDQCPSRWTLCLGVAPQPCGQRHDPWTDRLVASQRRNALRHGSGADPRVPW